MQKNFKDGPITSLGPAAPRRGGDAEKQRSAMRPSTIWRQKALLLRIAQGATFRYLKQLTCSKPGSRRFWICQALHEQSVPHLLTTRTRQEIFSTSIRAVATQWRLCWRRRQGRQGRQQVEGRQAKEFNPQDHTCQDQRQGQERPCPHWRTTTKEACWQQVGAQF